MAESTLSVVYLMMDEGNFSQASNILVQMISSGGYSLVALRMLAQCYFELGQLGNAEGIVRLYLKQALNDYDAQLLLAKILARVRFQDDSAREEISKLLEQIIQTDPNKKIIISAMFRNGLFARLADDLRFDVFCHT